VKLALRASILQPPLEWKINRTAWVNAAPIDDSQPLRSAKSLFSLAWLDVGGIGMGFQPGGVGKK